MSAKIYPNLDHIFYPTYYGRTNDDKTKISKSLVDLLSWAKEENANFLTVRRYEPCGAVTIKPLYAYDLCNQPLRVL